MILRPLLALAVFAFPSEFRREYRAQLFLDLDHRENERWYALRLFFDVIAGGMLMRFDLLRGDILFAIRVLAKAPLYTAIAAGTLAVAIGANAIVFSALEAVLLRPLPYANADRLALLNSRPKEGPAPSMMMWIPITFVETLQHSPLVEEAGSATPSNDPVRINGRVETLQHAFATPRYFSTLGVQPYIGRFFGESSKYQQIVISYAYWQTHYGGRSSAIGTPIRINESEFIIAGVAPPDMADPMFGSLGSEDVWTLVPQHHSAQFGAFPVIRMRPGVTIGELRSEVTRLWGNSEESNPAFSVSDPFLQPLRAAVFNNTQSLWILYGAVIAVLLIACANVTNLMLARAASRQDEFAARSALGATPRRIITQNLTEALVLCLFGCAFGLALGFAFLRPALTMMPGNLPRLQSTHIDWPVVLYVCILAFVITLIAGVGPALKAGSKNIGFRRSSRVRAALVVFEVGAAFALLVCSGLLLRSFVALTTQNLGFDPQHLYTASFLPRGPGDPAGLGPGSAPFDSTPIVAGLRDRIQSLPEVASAAVSVHVPFVNSFTEAESFYREGEIPDPSDPLSNMTTTSQVSPSYVHFMRIPVLQGRSFTNADLRGPDVMLVNSAFVSQFFSGGAALGKRMLTDQNGSSVRIVGIVGDTRESLTQDPQPMAYVPFKGNSFFQIAVRTRTDDPHLAAQIAAIAHEVYPRYGVPQVSSIEQAIRDDAANARDAMLLLSSLTVIALILAVAGIYGVVAFSVERRYHEIGVRVALGSTRRAILRSVVGAAALQSILGIAPGIVVAALAARELESELYQTAPFDPASFIGAIVLILVCTVLAATLPATRAMNIEPAQTLRYE